VIASYRRAAAAARADLFPAGLAWQIAWRCKPALGLYGPDGFHPSALGTYAAALVLYGRLFKAPLVGIRALAPMRVGGANSGPPSEGRSELPGARGSSALP
jgi:hypothetical protein